MNRDTTCVLWTFCVPGDDQDAGNVLTEKDGNQEREGKCGGRGRLGYKEC